MSNGRFDDVIGSAEITLSVKPIVDPKAHGTAENSINDLTQDRNVHIGFDTDKKDAKEVKSIVDSIPSKEKIELSVDTKKAQTDLNDFSAIVTKLASDVKRIEESFGQGYRKNTIGTLIALTEKAKESADEYSKSLSSDLDIVKEYDTDSVYVVGGDSVYKQLLPYCNEALVTFVDKKYDADAYFPNLDKDDEWELVSESEVMECFDIDYTFRDYIRKK